MHRKVLTIGLLVVLAGFFVLYQGTQILLPIAEEFGFVLHLQNETPLYALKLLNVPASTYAFLPADLKGGVAAKGSLQVGDGREIAFYVMDEVNFSQWKRGQPSVLLIAKPFITTYNFSFAPNAGGTYYFIFDNEDTSRRTIVFSLSLVETTIVLSPIMGFAGYELLATGVILSALAVRGGKKRRQNYSQKLQNLLVGNVDSVGHRTLATKYSARCVVAHNSRRYIFPLGFAGT